MEVWPSTRTWTLTVLIHSLLTFPLCLFPLPSYLVLAYSPLSPSFDLSSSVSMGAASKSERRRKQSQVCCGNAEGPEVGLRGGGQTLECLTKGWASLLMTPTGETRCSGCKGLHMYCYPVGFTRQCDQAWNKNKCCNTCTPKNAHRDLKTSSSSWFSISILHISLSFCSNTATLSSVCTAVLRSHEILCMNSDVTVQLLSRYLSVAKKGCFGTVRHNQ